MTTDCHYKPDLCVKFIADSGATEHLSNSKIYFNEYDSESKFDIECANKKGKFVTSGTGNAKVITNDNETFHLNNILYYKDLSQNLMSLRKFADLGLEIYLNNKIIDIYNPKLEKTIISGTYEKPFWLIKLIIDKIDKRGTAKSYYYTRNKKMLKKGDLKETVNRKEQNENLENVNNEFNITTANIKSHEASENEAFKIIENDKVDLSTNVDENSDALKWHLRLGHLSKSNLISLAKKFNFMKLDKLINDETIQNCIICLQANSTKLPLARLENVQRHRYKQCTETRWGR